MSTSRTILMQVAVLIVLGSLLGVTDGFLIRPISNGRKAPGTPPAVETPKPPATPVTEPSPAQPAHTQPASPAQQPGFVETPEKDLPAGQITLTKAKALFDNSAVFVDTRAADIYEKGHVPGAYRIGLEDFQAGTPQVLNIIPHDAKVVCYCIGGTCEESEAVAKMMNDSGYQNVWVMHDGFPGWEGMHYPVETGKGVQP